MIDSLFAPVLTFALLIAGTATIVSASFATPAAAPVQLAQTAAPQKVIALESVVIVQKRQPT